jgi:sigma54-dependent transcription regulator
LVLAKYCLVLFYARLVTAQLSQRKRKKKKKTATEEGEAVIFFLSVFWWATISSTFVHVLKPFLDASSAGKGAGIGE